MPVISDEMTRWWYGLQPKWRYKEDQFPDIQKDYSFILAGGKKGVFLLILCLAWWDRAHGRSVEKEKAKRLEAARASGMDKATTDFSDLYDHEPKWFNIVNDLISVMDAAQSWPAPGESSPGVTGITPAQKKRTVDRGDGSPRKKKKTS